MYLSSFNAEISSTTVMAHTVVRLNLSAMHFGMPFLFHIRTDDIHGVLNLRFSIDQKRYLKSAYVYFILYLEVLVIKQHTLLMELDLHPQSKMVM